MLESAELRRRAYLHALGIDQYVSRADLPGAAPTARLALRQLAPDANLAPRAGGDTRMPESPVIPPARSANKTAQGVTAEPVRPVERATPASRPERFSIAAVRAGGWLWLEDIGTMPLATEQVHLVRAMATALSGVAATSEVAQFNWPMHDNAQLDQGAEAAGASLGSFILRQLEDGACVGVVLLGESTSKRLGATRLGSSPLVATRSTREMLEQPVLKRQVWQDLKSHAGP